MKIEEFAAVTQDVIAKNGFNGFQPTACFPERRELRTLADFPDDEDPEQPVLEWAGKLAVGAKEFLVAFKIDASHFKVIRKLGEDTMSETFAVAHPKEDRLDVWYDGSAICLIAVGSHGDPLDLGDEEVEQLIVKLQECLRQSRAEETAS